MDYTGIYKADIGIKNGCIKAIGKAGNPDVMDKVNLDMIVGVTTDVISCEGLIVTAGAVDTHVHYICPQQYVRQYTALAELIENLFIHRAFEAIASGITTLVGGGTGPSTGSKGMPYYM